jgi:hypothetical protein
MATTPATVHFGGLHSSLTIARPSPRVVIVTIVGRDAGEHGDGPFRELDKDIERGPLAELIAAPTRAVSPAG